MESLSAGPIEFRSAAWDRNQDELARQLSRELVTHIGPAYGLARILERNAATALSTAPDPMGYPAARNSGYCIRSRFV